MDPKAFAPTAPGRLVPALNRYRKQDTGFIPDPLPREWAPPGPTRALLERAREALAALKQAGARSRSPRATAEFLRLREAIRSSVSARGAAATAKLLAFAPPAEGPYRDPRKAWRNAYRYRDVLRDAQAEYPGARPPALRALLERLHAGLFAGRPRRTVFPGRLRRGPLQMGDSAHYVPPPYEWVVPCLAALERDLARAARSESIDPLVFAFMAHYQFVTIHPFADGNGRVGRILLALMLNRALGEGAPLLYVSPYLARRKSQYTGRLFRVNTHGEWPVWIDFCLEGVIAEALDAARRIALLDAFLEKHGEDALLEALLETPAFSEPQFAHLCARQGRPASAELERLVAAGVVRAAPRGGSTRHFLLPGVVALLTRDAA